MLTASTGLVSTIGGNGTGGYNGEGTATSAELNGPIDVAVDASGNVFVADFYNHRVRKISKAGIISTIAGTGVEGYNGEGAATSAELNYPAGLAVDTAGNVYIAEYFGSRIRKVTPAGIISTVAGTGNAGFSGDGGLATGAQLYYANGVAVDGKGNLYIGDGDNRVRMVTASSGIITTVAGNGATTSSGDGGLATNAGLAGTEGIAVDASGNIFVASPAAVREFQVGGTITTVAGNGTQGYSGDGGPAKLAQIGDPCGLAVDGSGNLYLADKENARIREVLLGTTSPTLAAPTFSPAGGTYTASQTVTLNSTSTGATLYYTLDGSTPTTASAVYTAPLVVSASETINAIAAASGYTNSAVASAAYTINTPAAATPTFSPSAGTYTTAQTVTLSDITNGAAIYYTLDGSAPTPGSARYTVPLTVSSTATINAIAAAPGYNTSSVSSAGYTINTATAAAPIFSTGTGTYNNPFTVALSSGTTGATVYYTTDGSNPTTSSTPYTHNLTIGRGQTVNAIAAAPGFTTSAPASATYTMNLVAPAISQNQGSGTINITINQPYGNTASPTYYYTLDGSTPTTSSTLYSGPFPLAPTANSYIVHVLAVETGWTNSPIATLGVTIPTASAPAFSPAGGTFTAPTSVTLSSTSIASSIMYTVDGTTPSSTHGTLYSSPFTVSSTETVQAVTVSGSNAYVSSPVASATYTINLPTAATPTFSVGSGTYNGPQSVMLSSATAGATIYYTTNGSTPTTSSTKYTGAITVNSTETINAVAVATNYANSATSGATYTLQLLAPFVSKTADVSDFNINIGYPVFQGAPPAPTYYFTTDGTTPTTGSRVYTGQFQVQPNSGPITVQAIAVEAGYSTSPVTSLSVAFPLASSPTFSPNGGTFTAPATVTLSTTSTGAKIMYTTDGTSPTATHGSVYTAPITVSTTESITAIAVTGSTYYTPSGSSIASFTINLPTAAVPTFSVGTGTYNGPQMVTLSSTTSGAVIYYTSDGSTPTTSSTKYTGAITVNSTETINAIATATNYANSAVASAIYTMQLLAPEAYPTFDVSDIYVTIVYSQLYINQNQGVGPKPTFYYTTDGTTPTTSSQVYGSQFVLQPVQGPINVKTIAVEAGYTTSPVTTLVVAWNAAAAPTFSAPAGSYFGPINVTLSSASSGAAIHYTTDGTTPTYSHGIPYSGPIALTSSTFLQAIAVTGFGQGYNPSAVTSANYTITLAPTNTPTFTPAGGHL